MAILILFFVVFFYKIFFLGQTFFLGDNLLVIAPHKIFIWKSLKRGTLPLWNPHMWAGFPEVADITLGLFNPFNLVHFLFPNLGGITIVALIAYFLAFWGTYLFLKNEGLGKATALLGGIIFTFSGSMINISLDIIRIESICFLPWLLFFARKNQWLITLFLLTLDFLVGQTQHYYMAVLFILGFLFFFSEKKQRIKKTLFFLGCVLLSLLLSAFALLPQLELINLSSRAGAGFKYNTIWSMHPASLIRFFLADFWGKRSEGSFWGPNVTYSFGYLGFFSLVFILFNLKKMKKQLWYLAGAALATLLISFGKFNPFYKIFFLIPGFKFFRNPSSWLIIYSFSLACLTAFLADKIHFKKQKFLKKSILFIALSFIFIGLFLTAIWKYFPTLPNESLKTLALLIHKNLSPFHTVAVDRQITFLIARNLFILGILAFLWWKKFNLKFFVLIVFLDLFFFSQGDLFLAPKMGKVLKTLEEKRQIKFLQQNLGNYRFVSTAEFMPVRGISIYTGDYFKRPPFIQKQYWSLSQEEFKNFKRYRQILGLVPPNIFTAYNLASINGYSTFVLKNFNNYFSSPSAHLSLSAQRVMKVREQNKDVVDPTRVNFDFINLDDPRLSALSVKYVLADEKLNLKNHHLIYDDREYFIYENEKVLPRTQVFDQNNKLKFQPELIDINPNQLKINLKNYQYQNGDYLLLRDTYYPGWQASNQNGKQLKIKAQEIFRRVDLDSDSRSIVFKFQPKSFYLGLKISLTSILVIFAFSLFSFFKFFKAPKKPLKKLQSPLKTVLKKW